MGDETNAGAGPASQTAASLTAAPPPGANPTQLPDTVRIPPGSPMSVAGKDEKSVVMLSPRQFNLRLENHQAVTIVKGVNNIPESLASHPYLADMGVVRYDADAARARGGADQAALTEQNLNLAAQNAQLMAQLADAQKALGAQQRGEVLPGAGGGAEAAVFHDPSADAVSDTGKGKGKSG